MLILVSPFSILKLHLQSTFLPVLCIYMYVCMYIRVCIHTYIHTYICKYIHIYTHIYFYMATLMAEGHDKSVYNRGALVAQWVAVHTMHTSLHADA